MCRVSVTEFRNNLNYYLGLCLKEEVFITKHGKVVAVLSNPDDKYYQTLIKLCGCLIDADSGENYKDMIGERITKREERSK